MAGEVRPSVRRALRRLIGHRKLAKRGLGSVRRSLVMKATFFYAALAAAVTLLGSAILRSQSAALATPGFHHLHLGSTNPEAAIAFYTKAFPATSKATWGGMPALRSPNNVLVLFTRIDQPAATQPQTAMWHFGWHVINERATLARMRADGITILPLYTNHERGTVSSSTDTHPGTGGVLG